MADFLGKMAGAINKGVATVSTGSKTLLEKNRINAIIKSLEEEKRQLAEVMGSRVYMFCKENAEGDIPRADMIELCEAIDARNAQIEEQKNKIVELDAEMNQVKGSTLNASVASVCTCGHTNSAGAKFCAKCGSKIG